MRCPSVLGRDHFDAFADFGVAPVGNNSKALQVAHLYILKHVELGAIGEYVTRLGILHHDTFFDSLGITWRHDTAVLVHRVDTYKRPVKVQLAQRALNHRTGERAGNGVEVAANYHHLSSKLARKPTCIAVGGVDSHRLVDEQAQERRRGGTGVDSEMRPSRPKTPLSPPRSARRTWPMRSGSSISRGSFPRRETTLRDDTAKTIVDSGKRRRFSGSFIFNQDRQCRPGTQPKRRQHAQRAQL